MGILSKIGRGLETVGKVALEVTAAAAQPTVGQMRYESFVARHPEHAYPAWEELSPAAQYFWGDGCGVNVWPCDPNNTTGAAKWFERAPVPIEHREPHHDSPHSKVVPRETRQRLEATQARAESTRKEPPKCPTS